MRPYLTGIALAFCAVLLFFLCKDPTFFTNADTFDLSKGAGWNPIVYFGSNEFLSWRPDSWVSALAGVIASQESFVGYQLALLLIFAAGFTLYLNAQRFGLRRSIAAAMLCALIVSTTIGADTVAWSVLSWTPWIAIALLMARRTGEFFIVVFVLLFTLRAATTANHAVLLSYAGAVVLSLLPPEAARESRNREILSIVSCLMLIGGYLLFLGTVAHAVLPSYPPIAHLVPDDGIPGITRPLIGPDTAIPVVFHPFVQSKFRLPAALLIAFTSVIAAVSWRRSPLAKRASVAGLICAAAIVWDSIPNESLAQIGPLAAASRLFPDLFLIQLAPATFGLAVAFAFTAAAAIEGIRAFLVPLVIIAIAAITGPRILSTSLPLDPATSNLAGISPEDIVAPSWFALNPQVPGYEPLDWQNALNSPSRFTARYFGRGALAMSYLPSFAAPVPVSSYLGRAWASAKQDALPLLNDGRFDTRYSTGNSRQLGTESIALWFKAPVELIGAALQTGKFTTDFPRGVRIMGSRECGSTPDSVLSQGALLADFRSWQGPPKRTDERLPYFGGQEDVRIPFSRPVTVSCLGISQTGTTGRFDWSIAEVGLLLSRPPQPSS